MFLISSNWFRKLVCWLLFHNYTCAAKEGIKPTQKQLDDGMEGFLDYAKMYCKRCGHVYDPDWVNKNKRRG